ncbi:MAG: hypothetical protein ABR529_04785 [Actinomycetota bacterium]
MKKLISVALGLVLSVCAMLPALAHHNPRLFTNEKGDHGGTYDHGRNTFFWFSAMKRFNYLKVCIRKRATGRLVCKRFKIHRVPAASYRPWGVDFKTDRHFDISAGGYNVTFWHHKERLSPVLGFHRG